MRDEVQALGGLFELASGVGRTRMKIMIPIAENR